MIELKNVTKLYGKVIGVNDFTLTLEPGAYGLLGPNGSGKSTLLNLITGQLSPTLGSVRVDGHSPRNNSQLFKRLGYCPGGEGMYADVTGFDWVKYLQQLQGMTSRQAGSTAKTALGMVGMHSSMYRPISTYSRGMRQRTKLAQAIAHDPEFLILDEPFNGLDPIGRHELTIVLKNWIGRGKSLLFASHVLHEIESITQSFLLICGGRLLAAGTADDVHAMMVGIPSEIVMRCSNPHQLGARMVRERSVDSVRVTGDTLIIATQRPIPLYEQLASWLVEEQLDVFEMRSADESLQALFNSLMKMHRGEL
ncbi:ABC transporter ATP-binding protein [Schlesneria paludicola]|uniref:ABC transporter ATP-binding protein n=1 Tax=Schlesneria paludicola TaxID=360056 RepID=UPI00029A99C4|nr:ABC transporter ATP-binding protein [Schlesneria paludicola]